MSWICPSCNKSTCVGCEPADDVLPMTHEVLCACTDSCAKDAEIKRLQELLHERDDFIVSKDLWSEFRCLTRAW